MPDNVTNTDGLEKDYLLTVFLSPIHINFKASDEKLMEKFKELLKDVQESLSGLGDIYIEIEHSVVDRQ